MPNIEIRVDGLADLRKALKAAEMIEDRNALRDGLKKAADIVAQEAKRRVPTRTGRARDSIRATSGGNKAYVVGGKARVPYYGWLDFGSRRPVSGQPRRVGPWANSGVGPDQGRFIYPALDATEQEVASAVAEAVDAALDRLGL